jgi:uncharacterized repeat protein (TIGR04138 family)
MKPLTPDTIIDGDVACGQCEYNVRTLAVTARCPECGFPVLRSFIAAEAGAARGELHDAERVGRTALRVLSRLLRRNVDAIRFVLLVHQYAMRNGEPATPRLLPRRRDVSATELCHRLVEYALDHYGNADDALSTLRFWGVERSEDLGAVVAGLVEAGLMTPGEHDCPADFAGVCDFSDLFRQAAAGESNPS